MGARKVIALVAVGALSCGLTMQAQECKDKLPIKVELGLSSGWNVPSNRIGVVPLTQQSTLSGAVPVADAKILYRYNKTEALGLSFYGFRTEKSFSESLSNSITGSFIGLAWSKESKLRHSNWLLRNSLSAGYVHYNSKLYAEFGDNSSEAKFSRDGVGLNYDLTLARRVGSFAVGLQFGLKTQFVGKWSNSPSISPYTYNANLFGNKGNFVLMPTVGIVLTRPF